MKTLIAIPAMDKIWTITAQCLMNIQPVGEFGTKFIIGMQVDQARNLLAKYAVENGFDRILWLDSDMTFSPDIMERLSADLDAGWDVVCGIFFKRKFPVEPVVYKELSKDTITPYWEYPQNSVFPVAGFGFGAVMMKTEVLVSCIAKYGTCFSMIGRNGEDVSFSIRARNCGYKIMCDPSIQCGHISYTTITDAFYRNYREQNKGREA